MSYHEIEVLPSYTLKCRQCKYEGWARTAAIAEREAVAHIDMESVERGPQYPNYEHHVEIIPVTIVGRNL